MQAVGVVTRQRKLIEGTLPVSGIVDIGTVDAAANADNCAFFREELAPVLAAAAACLAFVC